MTISETTTKVRKVTDLVIERFMLSEEPDIGIYYIR